MKCLTILAKKMLKDTKIIKSNIKNIGRAEGKGTPYTCRVAIQQAMATERSGVILHMKTVCIQAPGYMVRVAVDAVASQEYGGHLPSNPPLQQVHAVLTEPGQATMLYMLG